MAQKTCTQCGTSSYRPDQKFCTKCGAVLPDAPATSWRGNVPVAVAAGAIILIILLLLAFFAGPLMSAIAGASAGSSSGGSAASPGATAVTPLPVTTAPATTTASVTTMTTVPTTVPTSAPPTATVTRTRQTVTTVPTSTVTIAVPVTTIVSQITLEETQIPSQPPASSYTSSNPDAPYIDPSALEARIHQLINVQRQQNGLSTLAYDSFLADIARGHSYDMSLRNYFEHTSPDGMDAHDRGDWAGYPCIRDYRSYYTEGISENLYQGYRYSSYLTDPNGTVISYKWNTLEFIANQAVDGWMNSQGHRENILNEKLQQEGIGVAFSSDDKIYVTENFC